MFCKFLTVTCLLFVSQAVAKDFSDVLSEMSGLITNEGDLIDSWQSLGSEDLGDMATNEAQEKETRNEFVNDLELPEEYKASMDGIKVSMDVIDEDLTAIEELMYALQFAQSNGQTSITLPEKFLQLEKFTLGEIAELAVGAVTAVITLIEQTQATIDDLLSHLRTGGQIITQPDLIGSLEVAKAYLDTRIEGMALSQDQLMEISGKEKGEKEAIEAEESESSGEVGLTEDEALEEEGSSTGVDLDGNESSGSVELETDSSEEETSGEGSVELSTDPTESEEEETSGEGSVELTTDEMIETESSGEIGVLDGSLVNLNSLLETLGQTSTDSAGGTDTVELQVNTEKLTKRSIFDLSDYPDTDALSSEVTDAEEGLLNNLDSQFNGESITNNINPDETDAAGVEIDETEEEDISFAETDLTAQGISNVLPSEFDETDSPASENTSEEEELNNEMEEYLTTLSETPPDLHEQLQSMISYFENQNGSIDNQGEFENMDPTDYGSYPQNLDGEDEEDVGTEEDNTAQQEAGGTEDAGELGFDNDDDDEFNENENQTELDGIDGAEELYEIDDPEELDGIDNVDDDEESYGIEDPEELGGTEDPEELDGTEDPEELDGIDNVDDDEESFGIEDPGELNGIEDPEEIDGTEDSEELDGTENPEDLDDTDDAEQFYGIDDPEELDGTDDVQDITGNENTDALDATENTVDFDLTEVNIEADINENTIETDAEQEMVNNILEAAVTDENDDDYVEPENLNGELETDGDAIPANKKASIQIQLDNDQDAYYNAILNWESEKKDQELLALKIALPVLAFFIILAVIAIAAFARRRQRHQDSLVYKTQRSTVPYQSYINDVEANDRKFCQRGVYTVEA